MAERPSPRFLSDTTAAYQNEIERRKLALDTDASSIFSETTRLIVGNRKRNILRLQNELEERKDDPSIHEIMRDDAAMIHERLTEEKGRLIRLYQEESSRSRAMYFFEEMMAKNSPVRQKLLPLLGEERSSLDSASQLASIFIDQEIEDDLFVEMLEWHIQNIKRERAETEELFKTYASHFRGRIIQAIDDGWLPIDKAVLDRRMTQFTPVVVTDPLSSDSCTGHHDASTATISVMAGTTHLESTYTHEMLHALSGRTILHYRRIEDVPEDLQHQRVGLHFSTTVVTPEGIIDRKKDTELFNWLNEAITEEITLRLLQEEESPFYGPERALLQKLYDQGLSRELLYGAYFENRETEAELGQQLPAWKAFVNHCNTVFKDRGGIRYLYKLQT